MGLLTVDARLDIVDANRALAELFGRPIVHVIGRPLVEVMAPVDPDVVARHIAACLQDRGIVTTELECLTASGERLLVELCSSAQQREQGVVVASMCRDIGARAATEASQRVLAELTASLLGVLDPLELGTRVARALVPQLAEACLVYGCDGGDHPDAGAWTAGDGADGRAVAASRSLPVLAAVWPESDGHARAPGAEAERALAEAASEVARGGPPQLLRVGEQDGYVVPIGEAPRSGAIALLRAPHDRRDLPAWRALADVVAAHAARAFAAARRYLEQERAVEARDDLVSMLSHDLRNGLGTVSMNCQLLLRRRSTDDPGGASQRRLEAMKRAADWMTELAEDLLDRRALELGQLVIERPPTPVEPVCREALALHESVAAEAEVRLVLEDEAQGAIVLADRCRVLQVLDNLLANALQASPPRSQVILRVSAETAHVRFSVRDAGPGIVLPDGGSEALFAGATRGAPSPRSRGRGLGLPIARTLVHAMGGEIGVARLPDVGTDFHFTLPRAPDDAA